METMERRNREMLEFIWKKRPLIFMVALITAVLSFFVTFLIQPKFKSLSRVYPANLQTFSDESPTEQLLQWIKSYELRRMFFENKSFNLLEKYRIDSNEKLKETYFNWKFEENFETKSTEFQSIEINVLDEDPIMAQKLNLAVIEFSDSLIRTAHNLKLREFSQMLELAMKKQLNTIDSLKSILYKMAKEYNINDYKIQLKEANKYYFKQKSKGIENKELKELLDHLGQKGPDQYQVLRLIEMEMDSYNDLKKEYEGKQKDLSKRFSYSVIIQKPTIPDSKYWPKRGLITLVSVLATVSLLIVLLLFQENRRKQSI